LESFLLNRSSGNLVDNTTGEGEKERYYIGVMDESRVSRLNSRCFEILFKYII
jgi:hypothetical protein